MENLIQYVNPCNKAFHAYLQDNNITALTSTLLEIELDAEANTRTKCAFLWFKFGKDDTLSTDIWDIEMSSIHNRQFMIEQFESVTSLNGAELQVYYS